MKIIQFNEILINIIFNTEVPFYDKPLQNKMSEGLLNYKIKIRKTLSAKQIRIHIAGSVTTRGLIRV